MLRRGGGKGPVHARLFVELRTFLSESDGDERCADSEDDLFYDVHLRFPYTENLYSIWLERVCDVVSTESFDDSTSVGWKSCKILEIRFRKVAEFDFIKS